jgi:hypothetical protein
MAPGDAAVRILRVRIAPLGDLMVSLSNHEVGRVEARCHDLVLRLAQDEVYCGMARFRGAQEPSPGRRRGA